MSLLRKQRVSRRQVAASVAAGLRRPEEAYVKALRGVMRAIAKAYMAELVPMLGEIAGKTDAHNSLSNSLDLLGVKVQAALPGAMAAPFHKMSVTVNSANAKSQGALLGITPRDTGVLAHIERARDRNIQLVEKAHRAYSESVRDIVGDPNNFGLQVDELKALLLERGDVSESRAELIARDQTLKLNGEITQVRQQAAGVNSYVWSTSLDERVRDEHAELEGEVFSWDSPPEPGHPGQDFQCRCVAIPAGIEELDDIFG